MTRLTAAVVAVVALVGLSLAAPSVAHAELGPWLATALAAAKIGLVGAVFLELDRSWPGWAALSAGTVGLILGIAALLTSTGG